MFGIGCLLLLVAVAVGSIAAGDDSGSRLAREWIGAGAALAGVAAGALLAIDFGRFNAVHQGHAHYVLDGAEAKWEWLPACAPEPPRPESAACRCAKPEPTE